MAHPSRYYNNPLNAALYSDRYKTGCHGCENSIKTKLDFWVCKKSIKGYPRLGKGECESWEQKKQKK